MGKRLKPGLLSLGAIVLALVAGSAAMGQTRESTASSPWLGVYTQALTPELREGIDFEGDGVLVSRVVDGSPADRAGVEKGDVIVSFNSRTVSSPEDLSSLVRRANVGQTVALRVVREGDTRSLSVRLDPRPGRDRFENEDRDDSPPPDLRDEDPGDRDHDGSKDDDDDDDSGPMDHMKRGDMGHMRVFDMPATPDAPMAGMMNRARLGVRIEDLSSELNDYFRVPGGHGVLVVDVVDGSAAEKAGIKSGDVITRVGDRAVSSSSDLIEALQNREAGNVSLTIIRHGATRRIDAQLQRAPRTTMRVLHRGPNGDLRELRGLDELNRGPSDDADLHRQIDDLKRQLEDLKRELRDKDRDRN